MEVKIFGAVSSPAICAYVLRKAVEDAGEDGRICCEQIADQLYVDN